VNIEKEDFVVLYRTGKIILIKKDLKPVAIDYQSSLSFELSDACQIKENKYILVVNYQSHTEYSFHTVIIFFYCSIISAI
jgi:hypothetical protein